MSYITILAGEVKRRKYFRKLAKRYRRKAVGLEDGLSKLMRDYNRVKSEYDGLRRNFDSRLERKVNELVAAEKFSIEYRYCQQIDALEAKLSVYEVAQQSTGEYVDGMVLSADQCERLNEALRRLKDIAKKYEEACDQLNSIRKIVNGDADDKDKRSRQKILLTL